MKALVLGGTGFVGMNLTRALVARGEDVRATRRARANTLFARRLGAPLVTADLDSEAELCAAMAGRDVVFNCAGHYPRYSLDRAAEVAVARRRAATSLAAARRAGVARYVLVSSMATVGPPRARNALSDEGDAPDRASRSEVYHSVKIAIEEEVLRSQRGAPEVVVLCPGAIFGELDVIPANFPHRISRYRATKCGRKQLRAKTNPQYRHVSLDRFANYFDLRDEIRIAVDLVRAHWPAEDDQGLILLECRL